MRYSELERERKELYEQCDKERRDATRKLGSRYLSPAKKSWMSHVVSSSCASVFRIGQKSRRDMFYVLINYQRISLHGQRAISPDRVAQFVIFETTAGKWSCSLCKDPSAKFAVDGIPYSQDYREASPDMQKELEKKEGTLEGIKVRAKQAFIL